MIAPFGVRAVLRTKAGRVALVQVHTFVRGVQDLAARTRAQRSL